MRLARWLIPVVLFGVSGTTPPRQHDSPRPTRHAAAPVDVHAGIALFDLPPNPDGQLVVVVSALGRSNTQYDISVQVAPARPHKATAVSPPLLAIRPYRPLTPRLDDPTHFAALVAATSTRDVPTRVFDVPLLNRRPLEEGGSLRVRARPAAVGQRTVVYLDEAADLSHSRVELAEAIVRRLETSIMPAGDRLVGPPADVDGDHRLAVLLTPVLAHLQNGRTTVGGFVRADDFRKHLAPPRSNRADMIYLNINLIPDQHLTDVLAHEYRHVLAFSHRDALGHDSEHDWINEALAHLAEHGSTNISHRVRTYLEQPSRYPLVVPDYYRAGLWRCDGVRGATFLFLDWCRQQHGEQLVREMLTSPNTGIRNLVVATRTPFARLFRNWSVGMLYNRTPYQDTNPAVRTWDGGQRLDIQLATTATCYLAPARIPPGAMIRIQAPTQARLQVTVALRSPVELASPTEAIPRPSTSDVP
jgi:hypothetical protein